jgi:hypothetical protein
MTTEWLSTTANRIIDLDRGARFLRDLLSIEKHRLEFSELGLDGAMEVIHRLWVAPTQQLLERLREIVPDVEELREQAEQLLEQEAPEEIRFLFASFTELKQRPEARSEYSWPLFDRQATRDDFPAEQLLLTLNTSFGLTQTIQAMAELPHGMLLDPLKPEALRIAMRGSLTLGQTLASAMPAVPLSVQVDTMLSGESGIELFYRHLSERRIGEALLLDLKRLVSPFSLDDLSRGFFSENLAAVRITASHQASIGGRVGLAQDVEFTSLMGGELGVSFGFRKSLAGQFEYLIHPTGAGNQLALKLRRLALRQDEQSNSLGVTLSMRGWASKAYPMIRDKLGDAEAVLKQVESLIPGQDLFREKLGEALTEVLDDFEYQHELLLALGVSAGVGGLGELVKTTLLDEIESSRRLWQGDLQERCEEIKAELLNKLPLSTDIRNKLDGKLQQALEQGLGRLWKALNEQIGKLVSGAGFTEFAERLNRLGHEVDKRIRKVEKRNEAVSAPLRRELDRLQKRLIELKNRFADAAKAKISMGLESLSREEVSKDLNLSLVLDPDHAQAQALLRELITADLDGVFERIRAWQQGEQDNPILAANGNLTRYTRLTQESGFACVLFGNGFSGRTRIDADAKLIVDAHGNIQCLSRMEFNRLYKGMHDERELQIVDAVELAAARVTDSLSLAVNLSLTDEDLTPAEARAFFQSAEQVGLLQSGTAARAVSALTRNNLRSGRLDIGMSLNKRQLLRLLQLRDEHESPADQPLDEARVLEVAASQVAAICTLQPPSKSLLKTLGFLREQLPGYAVPVGDSLQQMILCMTRDCFKQSDKWLDSIYGDQLTEVYQASNALSWVRARYVAVNGCHGDCRGRMRQILPQHLAQEPDYGDTQNRQYGLIDALNGMREILCWDVNLELETLRIKQSEIGRAFKSWFLWQEDFPKWWMLNTKEIRPLTLAFFKTIAQLAQTQDAEQPLLLSASLTLKGEQGEDRKRILLA